MTLSTWTIYERPRDFPDDYVVREWQSDGNGNVRPTPEAQRYPTLEAARAPLRARGLVCIERSPGDDPCIVEVWL